MPSTEVERPMRCCRVSQQRNCLPTPYKLPSIVDMLNVTFNGLDELASEVAFPLDKSM